MILLAFTLQLVPAGSATTAVGLGALPAVLCHAQVMLSSRGATKRLGLEGTSRDCLVHSLSLSNTLHHTQYPHTVTRSSPSLPFSRLNSLPALSSSPCMADPPSPYSSLWCFVELTPVTSCLSYTGEPRTGCSIPDVGSQHGFLKNCEPLRISVEVAIKDYELRRQTKIFFFRSNRD